MKTLYIDCFAGAAGDMLLSAMIDLGIDRNLILDLPDKLGLPGLKPGFTEMETHGLQAIRFDLEIPENQPHRHLKHIREIITGGKISSKVKDKSIAAFELLANAEGKVHGTGPEKVHFHEVGADDAIIDIVGYFIALEAIGWPKVYSSPPILGRGMIRAAHGMIPLPAPAVVEILKNVPVRFTDFEGETVTPTGATLLVSSAEFGDMPRMSIEKIGCGAGSRTYENRVNVVRLFLGEETAQVSADRITVIETNIDDMNPQIYDHLFARLYDLGVLEAFITPVIMKKNRPGNLLTVLCKKPIAHHVSNIIFSETSTAGLRLRDTDRITLDRREEVIGTSYGKIRIKILTYEGGTRVIPEFDDCRRVAGELKVPLQDVIDAAKRAFFEKG